MSSSPPLLRASLAIGDGADQAFLFGLAERFGGQAAYIDTKKDLNETLMGTLSRFFGALSSIAAKSATLTLDLDARCPGQVDLMSSVIPSIFKASATRTGCTIQLGSLMAEQTLHFTLTCRLSGNGPPNVSASLPQLCTLTLQCSALSGQRKPDPIVASVTMPVPLTLQNNVVVVQKVEGGVPTLGHSSLEPGGASQQVEVNAGARLHLAGVTLEPLEKCILRLAMVPDPAPSGGSKMSVTLESGRIYIHTTGEAGLGQLGSQPLVA